MLDKLGKDAAARKFVRAYDKYTIALCGTALLAYGAQQYFVASPARPVPPPRASIGSRARDSIPPDAHPPPATRARRAPTELTLPRVRLSSQGWDDAPGAIPKEVPVPKAEKGGAER